MKNRIHTYIRRLVFGTAASLVLVSTSPADDIDVYVAPPQEASVGQTLVVFTLDLRPNVMASQVCTNGECDALFNEVGMGDHLDGSISFFEMFVAALKKVLRQINSYKVKVALMVPHADTTGGGKSCVGYVTTPQCSNGAYVLSGFKSTGDDPNTTSVDESLQLNEFFKKLENLPLKDGANWVHAYQLKELFFEMYRYITAGRVYNGQNGLDDYGTGNVNDVNIDDVADTISVNPNDPEPTAELMWDTAAQKTVGADKFYTNTLDTAEDCTKIFSVNVTFANSSQDSNSDAAIAQAAPDGFGFDPDNSGKGEDEVLQYLAGKDLSDTLVGKQNIISYFITKASGTSGGGGAASRANDWAQAGGTGSAFVVGDDPNELVRFLSGLFNQILSVSTTFVSASVPANVFNRAETKDEVFIAVFDADENDKPFWPGNVKRLNKVPIPETVFKDTNGDGKLEAVTVTRDILVDTKEYAKWLASCPIDSVTGKPDVTKCTYTPNSAIDSQDGRLTTGALTFWTQTGDNNAYLPPPVTTQDKLEYQEGTDGRKVARGGSGQVKPGYLDTNSPGEVNSLATTTMSGPRKVFTEPATATDGLPSDSLTDLDADGSFITATALLQDTRTYPGSPLTYGDYLFRKVMADCSACTSYSSASATEQQTAQLRVNNLIRFARGFDVGLDTPMSTTPPKRSWWQADPLHTRPLPLVYGARTGYTDDRPDIRLLVAGNDGMVQMIRDGQKSDGTEDGVEAWAFLPSEFVPLQKRLLQNTLGLYNPGFPVADGDPPRVPLHPYAMDGAPTALIIDNNLDGTIDTSANDQVYVFIGERRGGKRYYALDLSDPDNPKFLWSLGKDDASGDFTQLGESWSQMRAGIMDVEENGVVKKRPIVMFTGGYNGDDHDDGVGDLGKDSRVKNANSNTEIVGTDDDEGNALFIVNALTGQLIWKAIGTTDSTASYDSSERAYKDPDLVDSVPSSPALLDADGDGLVERAYFPDTGGNVWRFQATDPDPATWTITKLFSGGRHFQSDNADDRRFFHAPDVVLAEDSTGKFDAVIVASGDRAYPLATDVENWVYMIKDRFPDPTVTQTLPLTPAELADLTDDCLQGQAGQTSLDFSSCTDTNAQANLVNGWKVQLMQCEAGGTDPHCGEKGLSSPVTLNGTIVLTTYLPSLGTVVGQRPTTCGTKEGAGLLYGLDLQTATANVDLDPDNDIGGVESPDRFVRLKSPSIPPAPVPVDAGSVLPSDLTIRKIPGRTTAKTFWYDRQFN